LNTVYDYLYKTAAIKTQRERERERERYNVDERTTAKIHRQTYCDVVLSFVLK
jgi:hypothetical protein